MTDKPDPRHAEAHVHDDFDTGKKIIILRVFKNLEFEAVYALDYLGVYEKGKMPTRWNVLENEND